MHPLFITLGTIATIFIVTCVRFFGSRARSKRYINTRSGVGSKIRTKLDRIRKHREGTKPFGTMRFRDK